MTDLPFNDTLYVILCLHCLIGAIGSLVAQQKGYPFGKWMVIGLIGGTAAFIYALWMKKMDDAR
jgi:predicted Co/Zn/Cd cation transporter (cation efflux family)